MIVPFFLIFRFLALQLWFHCGLVKYRTIFLFCRPYITESSVKVPTFIIIVLSEIQTRIWPMRCILTVWL